MELLESIRLYMVMTIVDFVSKTTYFILIYTTVGTKEVARLFLYYIYVRCGLHLKVKVHKVGLDMYRV